MKKVYISIVSHNQEELIKKNFSSFPKKLGKFKIKLSILDNCKNINLRRFCEREKIFYSKNAIPQGFGRNHNNMFKLLSPYNNDIFIVCNPDIIIQPTQLKGLLESFIKSGVDIMAPRSYLDIKSGFLDYPDRYFPYLLNFFISILIGKRLHYGSNLEQEYPEWISGSFMIFKPKVFKELGGFDEKYHMYCEDIDICYRAKERGYKIKLDKSHYIVHDSRMHSRKLFSKNIWWHIRSAFRFSFKTGRVIGLKVAK